MERYHIFKLGLAILFYAAYCIRPMVANAQKLDDSANRTKKFEESDLVFYHGVEGQPGVDFPVLSHIPRTTFSCRNVDSGYYADLETDCQVFHICEDNKKISFLCPNGTIFQQSELICEWWFKVNCTNSPNLYEESAEQLREENARRKLSRRVQNHGAVMRTEERSSISTKQKASKRVFNENRINNHATNYRDNLSQTQQINDLSRSSSSDFVRNDEHRSSNRRNNGRKPVQFQTQASVNNQDQSFKKNSQRVVDSNRRKTNRNDANSVNDDLRSGRRGSTTSSNSDLGFNGRKNDNQQTKYQENFSFGNSNQRNSNNRVNKVTPSPFINDFQDTDSNDRNNYGDRSSFSNSFQKENDQYQNIRSDNQNNYQSANNADRTSSSNSVQEQNNQNHRSRNNNHKNHQPPSGNNRFVDSHKDRTTSSNSYDEQKNQNQSIRNKNQRNHQSANGNNRFVNSNTDRPSSSNSYHEQNDQNQNARNNNQKSHQSFNDNNNDSTDGTFASNSFQEQNNQNQNIRNNNQKSHQSFNENNNDRFGNNDADETSSSSSFQEENDQNQNIRHNNQKNHQSPSDNNRFVNNNSDRTSSSNSFQEHNDQNQNVRHNNQNNHQSPNDENRFVNSNSDRTSSFNSYQEQNDQNQEVRNNNQKNYEPFNDNNNDRFANNNAPSNYFHQNAENDDNESVDQPSTSRIDDTTPTSFQSSLKPENPAKDREGRKLSFGDQNRNSHQHFDTVKEMKDPVPLNIQSNSHQGSTTQSTTSSGNLQNHKYLPEGKDSNVKQTSTVSLTRNDIINKRLEASDSDEAQITQETASFYKNSFNKINQEQKTTPNPHPNHRQTYSELKEPKYYSTKIYSAISSVTPQYLTTQPINNGRPFIGSQVGTTLKTTTIPPTTVTSTLATTTFSLFNTGKTDSTTFTTGNPTTITNTERFNVGRTDKSLRPVALSTLSTFTPRSKVTVPPHGSFNLGSTKPVKSSTFNFGSTKPIESSTGRIIDHATVYGKFVKGSSTTPSSGRKTILLSKSLFGGNGATPTPFSLPTTPHVKSSAEILSTSDSFNRNPPQVRFFGKVHSSSKLPGVELNFNGNNGNSLSTTPKPFTVSPLSLSTFSPELNSVTPTTEFVSTTFNPTTTLKPFTSKPKGFFVTKNLNTSTTQKSLVGEIIRPRPFQLPPDPDFGGKAVYTSTTTESTSTTPITTYPTYKISSASPFSGPSSPEPTQPTPFSTATPTLPSTFENVDSMINALAEMASHNFTDSPRPGLFIPPSAGPQTLHTLAVYFANALDGIAADKEEDNEDEENLTKKELEKKKLTELLTQMTMNRYNELFGDDKEEEETTTVVSRSGDDDEDNDLEGQHSKGPAQATPKVRQLAKVFTQALSSYLDDPATFKKVLEEVRPTEPPALDNEDPGDDELLNFSDADSKSSFPPFFPTPLSIQPTWGYLVAYNTSQNIDVKNSINSDIENLQGADSQSFVSQFNKLQNQKETTTKSSIQLPDNHWTTSPDVNKLFKTAFSFDPASINENFGTTETVFTTTEEDTEEPEPIKEHHEIKYEVRALPQLELNSTQVHGILIDFMNTTKTDHDNRLQRILKKLNTTEDEFLAKMKEIEGNPLTRRLILLLINECGSNATDKVEARAVPVHTLLAPVINNTEILETASSVAGFGANLPEPRKSASGFQIVDPSLGENSQDARALQLLNSLYTIASKFGK